MKMDYTCLQDILDDIFYYDDGEGGEGMGGIVTKHVMVFLPKFAVKKELLERLAHYFEMWDLGEREIDHYNLIGDFYEYERASWCFYYLFRALSFLKDPSFIPEVMGYFPAYGKERWSWENDMNCMWTQPMVSVVTNTPGYMPWVMRSLHLLHPGARWAAKDLMSQMLFDTFYRIKPNEFPNLPVVDALPLGKRDFVLSILDEMIEGYKKFFEEKKKKIFNNDPLQNTLRSVESYKEDIACTEYVRGQLLLLPKEVISIGHR